MEEQGFRLGLDLGESTAKTREFNQALQSTATVVNQGTIPALHQLDVASNQVRTRNLDLGQSMLATSYAVQDFTSQLGTRGLVGGLSAVQNNIPMIIAGLGAGAGLTGVISMAAIGVQALIQNWDKLVKLWNDGGTDKEVARMQALLDKAEKTADQAERYRKIQKEGESKVQGGFEDLLSKSDPKKVEQAIQDALIEQWMQAKGTINEQQTEALRKQGTGLFGAMPKDKGALFHVQRLMNDPKLKFIFQGRLGKDFGADLHLLSPENQAALKRQASIDAVAGFGAEEDLAEMEALFGPRETPPRPFAGLRGFGAPLPVIAPRQGGGAGRAAMMGRDPAAWRAAQRAEQARNPHPTHVGPQGQMGYDPRNRELQKFLGVTERGQAATEHTQAILGQNQAVLARLQVKVEQIEARNKRLEEHSRHLAGRDTLLQRGR